MDWPLQPEWEGEDVFVLGGGPSVRHFPLERLKVRRVIGCNDAYLFGRSVVDVVVFGDPKWYHHHKGKPDFINFSGPKITNSPKLEGCVGITWAPRQDRGFAYDAIGWNGNTGSAAINVALLLGALRIFLVGFDMQVDKDGNSNWHPNLLDKPTEEHYNRYKQGIGSTACQIAAYWPGVEVWNLNPESTMDTFPKTTWEKVFGKEALCLK